MNWNAVELKRDQFAANIYGVVVNKFESKEDKISGAAYQSPKRNLYFTETVKRY